MTITIWRDSVHAGDDADAPHEIALEVAPDESIASVTRRVLDSRYLPSISGGEATWILESHRPLAVVAQQWASPRFLLDEEAPLLGSIERPADRDLNFIYWCQIEPERVFDCLVNGRPLPDPYGRASAPR